MEVLGKGRCAEVLDRGDGTVLKLFWPGFPPEHADTELARSLLLNAAGGVAPLCRGRADSGGRYGIIYDKCPGRDLGRLLAERPWAAGRLARVLAAGHRAVFAAPPPEGLPHIADNLRWAIGRAPLADGERAAALAALDALPRQPRRLLHGDFHMENLLVSGGEGRAVDWANAAVGPAAADVARTLVILNHARPPAGALPRWREELGHWVLRAFARSYRTAMLEGRGVDRDEVAAWLAPTLAGRLWEADPAGREARSLRRGLRRALRRLRA